MLMTTSGYKLAIGSKIKGGTDGALLFVGPDSTVSQSLINGLVLGNGTGYVTAVPNQDYAPSVNPVFHGSVQINGATNQTSPLLLLYGQPAAVVRSIGNIDGVWANSNDATRLGRVVIRVSDYTGVDQEGLRVESTGSAAALGFFGVPAVPRPSGDVTAALDALGLVLNPTLPALPPNVVTLTGDTTGSGSGSIGTTVVALNGVSLGTTTAIAGNLLIGSGSRWISNPISGDVQLTDTGQVTLKTINGTAYDNMVYQNSSAVSITGGTITGMPVPINGSDVATKNYVDSATTGLSAKTSCRSASKTNLSATYNNGTSGVGATLTGALAAFSLDGVAANVNDRVLIKDQTTQFQNGIYSVTTVGSSTVAWVLTRTIDYNSSSNISEGTYTVIEEGTTQAGTLWLQTSLSPVTVGISLITFTQMEVAPQIITFTGDISGTGSGSITTTVVALNGVGLGVTTAAAGSLLIGSGTQWDSHVPSGDATISANGVITVTATNGKPFVTSAITDTTNAANITSGVLATARMGSGTASSTTYLRGDGIWAALPPPPSLPSSIPSSSATYIVKTADASIPNAFALSTLTTGILKVTGTTGVLSTAVADTDYLTPTGSGAGLMNLNASALASGTVPIPRLGSSGTPGSTTFLRGDGTWATTGTVTQILTGQGLTGGPISSTGTVSIPNNGITSTLFRQSAASSLVGNPTSATGNVQDITLGAIFNFQGTVLATVALTGDVTTTANSFATTVTAINGAHLGSTVATAGNLLIGSGSIWVSQPITGDLQISPTGVAQLVSFNSIPFGSMAGQSANAVAITGGTITGLPIPSAGSDAANKSYVDNATAGLSALDSCRLATTGNLAAIYNNGTSGVGATLTNSGTLASFTLDSVVGVSGNRVLVKDQSTPSQNGIYVITNIGSTSVAWILTRSTDFNSSSLISEGKYTVISEGTVNVGSLWLVTSIGTVTVGTTAIYFTRLTVAPQTLTLTGDVTGTGTGSIITTVTNINGTPLGSTVATAGYILIGSGSQWVSSPVQGDATLAVDGTLSVTRLAGTPLGSTTPTAGSLLIGSGTQFVSHLISGDATISAAGVLAVTKTNGVAFAPSATIDTTNAANITSGTLPAARLPNPSSSTLGGIQSITPVTHQWINSISTSGVPQQSQPAFTDISGTITATQIATGAAATNIGSLGGDLSGTLPNPIVAKTNNVAFAPSATIDTTNAANISSGTLPAGRLPAFTGAVTTPIGSTVTTFGAIPTLTVLANIAAGTASPAPATLSAWHDAAISNVQGTLLFRSSSVWSGLAPGVVHQPLESGGPNADIDFNPNILMPALGPTKYATGLIWSVGPCTAVSNTATKTSILAGGANPKGTNVIPANVLTVGSMLRWHFFGTYGVAAGSPTITMAISLGGTVILQAVAAPSLNNQFTLGTFVQITGFIGIESIGATGTAGGGAEVLLLNSTNVNSNWQLILLPGGATPVAGVTINTTTALNFDISITWSAANASNKFQVQGLSLWLDNN